jgi:hypothetical protein
MVVIITRRLHEKRKIWYCFERGKDISQQMASGIFTYTRPLVQAEKITNDFRCLGSGKRLYFVAHIEEQLP